MGSAAAKTKTFPKCETSVYIWFLQVVTVLGLTSLAIWASITPKTPTFAISNLDLKPHQNDTAFARSSSVVALNMTVSNPNRMAGIFFDEINVTVRCKNDSVGAKSVPGFYLGHESSDWKEVEMSVNCGAADGRVDLRVGLETRVRYKILRFKSRNRRLVFEDCVENGRDGQMVGTRDMKLS